MYFRLRSGRSNQRGTVRLRRKSLRPSFQRTSETVPTGHNQEQNVFFSSMLDNRKAAANTIAAGWIDGARWVTRKYLRFIRPAMGSQPSIPAGRSTERVPP